jgi:hypothetical protein
MALHKEERDMDMTSKEFVVHYLTEHKRDLLARREQLLKPLQELDQEIEHITATMRSLEGPARKVEAIADFPIAKLRKLTQVQALVVIAKHNGGIIKAQESKRLLIRAGVMRETKNSTNVIHAVIIRSEKFERVRPGEYRLKEGSERASTSMLDSEGIARASTSGKPVQ